MVAFTDTSGGTPTSWSWNFGDGSTSTSQNPSHTYTNVGSYTVSLRATNASGYDDMVRTNYIAVCTEVIVYPHLLEHVPEGNQQRNVSGSLSNLQADDDRNGIQCDACQSSYRRALRDQAADTTPDQLAGVKSNGRVT